MSSVLLLYGVYGGCFFNVTVLKAFQKKTQVELNGFVYAVLESRLFLPCKMKKLFGETQHRLAYFSQICGNVTMRLELSDQDCKAIESAISTEMHTASFSITGDAKAKHRRATRE